MKIQAIFYNNPDQYPPIINSSRLLAQYGFEVNILCREYGGHWNVAYPPQVRVRRLRTNARSSIQQYLRFLQRVMRYGRRDAAMFIGHDMHGFLAAKLLSVRYRKPLIYHCHDFAQLERNAPLGGRLVSVFERRFARTANLVIVPDAERGQVVKRQLRLPKPPLIVANAPLERPCVSNVLAEALAARGRRFHKIVFRQGRIGPGHALESTVRSLTMWKERGWGFVVMGPGEADYIQALQHLAESLNRAEQFVVLPPVGYDQVSDYTVGAHLGHALYEPIHINNVHITTASNKIMEYMAARLPLLVSDTPSLRALVEKHECGVAADETSPASIAAAVNALLGDPISAQQMGIAAKRAFDEVFCYERQFAPALDAIQKLADGH